jgi:hypothetical protein
MRALLAQLASSAVLLPPLAVPVPARVPLSAWTPSNYLFSGDIDDSYTPHLGTTPVHFPGARLRHDFVLLAGMSWRAH